MKFGGNSRCAANRSCWEGSTGDRIGFMRKTALSGVAGLAGRYDVVPAGLTALHARIDMEGLEVGVEDNCRTRPDIVDFCFSDWSPCTCRDP